MTYDEPPGFFHPNVMERLNAFEREGVIWCTNSGRDKQNQLEILKKTREKGLLHLPGGLVCCESLVYVQQNGDYQGLQPWNDDARKSMISLHRLLQTALQPVLTEWRERFNFEQLFLDEKVTAFLVEDDGQRPAALHLELEKVVKKVKGGIVTRNGGWVVAMPDRLGKGKALNAYLQARGIPRTRALAIGDHLNDLDMLNGASAVHVACPANAEPEVKQTVCAAGGYVAQAEGPAGTLEALNHYLS